MINRRAFLQFAPLLGAFTGILSNGRSMAVAVEPSVEVATNSYPWGTFAKREKRDFSVLSHATLAGVAAAGFAGYEPIINSPDEFDGLAARLEAHGLAMNSLYVNSTLHDESAEASITAVLAIARRAFDELGTTIIVTNPSPIRWGGPENKSDAQLIRQAKALDRLGAELRKLGPTLAYHNHDAELRLGGREFHHMLTSTDADNVKLCLDAHWVFRGCGDSQVALFDALEHYGDRIVELHLRQSQNGVWSQVFTADGDIEYARLAQWLDSRGLKPRLTLEQAVEAGTPQTLDVVEAHRQGRENAARLRLAST